MICLDNWFSLSSVEVRIKASLREMTITPLWFSEASVKRFCETLLWAFVKFKLLSIWIEKKYFANLCCKFCF